MATRIEIADNIHRIQERIAASAIRSGRAPEDIRLLAVTKTVEPERIRYALEAGVADLGENYLQEALQKQPQIHSAVNWHFIGHLQRNKVKAALPAFSLIHGVDSISLAQEISRRAQSGTTVPGVHAANILLQVNTSGEESKFGAPPQDVIGLAEAIGRLPHINLLGLMTIGHLEPRPEGAREEFKLLAALYRKLAEQRIPNVEMRWLSMGMTHDFEVAIEEGANIVRVGRGIFGERR